MKKIMLAVIAGTMILSNVAFASTKTGDVNNTSTNLISAVDQHTGIHVCTADPD